MKLHSNRKSMTLGRALALAGVATLASGCGPQWTVLSEDYEGVVALSVWGASEDDAYAVGGGLGNGAGALVLHLHQGKWTRPELGTQDTLWWVHGFSPSELYAVGERGAVYRGAGDSWERMPTPTTATLFGIWGASPDDLWAVGGSPQGDGPNDVLLHYDGRAWAAVEPPERLGVSYLKIWGAARDDIFIVGHQGVILHYDGQRWSRQSSPVRASLFTAVGSSGTDVYAVGGPPMALLHYDGTSWSQLSGPSVASGLGGVSVGARGEVFVVGLAGVRWRRDTSGRWLSDSDTPPLGDLHAVWAAPDGSALAVGGNYVLAGDLNTPRRGIVAYYGSRPPPRLP
jgi:hypothetical protein